ncbi:cytoskeleton-associated protein 5-like [Thamnophis elegans]|uniref:cytoskeleton-associated protein 5-like n=1 Tax=Thamnophis elegans TaxID=35005 RepID=UPI00137822C6|nr:cytoskeleton-associated protein 5-like [Thamnophis elegans]
MLMPRDMTEKELPEESCELEAATVLPESCLQHLDSSNWKERISCLEALERAVEEMENHQVPCQALVRLLHKEPGWNETKLQVMQKKLHIVTLIARKGNFSRTSARFVLGNLVDKIGDVICSSDTKEALTAVAEACGLPWTAEKVTKAAFMQDSPRTHAETLNWLSEAIRDFGFDGLEAKMFVSYIKVSLSAAHPDVRTSAFNLLSMIFLYVGSPLRGFFEDERPLLLSQIDARFEQLSGQSPPPQIRGRCRFCRNSANAQQGGDAQPYWKKNSVDLRQKISAELMSKVQDASWKVRKEGLEEVSGILSEITSIQPHLGDLPLALKACLHDSNKVVVKQTLVVLQQLAKAMGPGLKHHVKTLGMSILALLKDSKSSLRPLALATIEAWAEHTGMKEWLEGDDLFADPKKDMVSPRQGFLGWLVEKLPSSNSASADLLRCVPHLYSALENSHEETRAAAQEALPFFLLHLGIEKMCEATSKLKPASRDQVLLVLERVKESRSSKATLSLSRTLSKLPRGKSWSRSEVAPPPPPPPPPCPPAPSSSTENVGSNEMSMDVRKANSEGTVPKTKRFPATKSQTKVALKEGPGKLGPIFMIVPKGKEQRAKEEKALKVLRWNFSTPSSKYIEQLKAQMSGCFSNWLQEEMFHSNFQHHIKALAVMSKHLETEKDGVLSCLDLILKWLSLRLFDTNTWVLMKTLEYLQRLFHLLMEEKYQLTDSEASSFLPYLLLKLGGTKESILKEVRAIVKQMFFIYPAFKTFSFLLEGAQAKNTNQRIGCLKELGWMLKKYGPEVCQPNPSKILKTLLVLTGDYNNAVHTAALKVIAIARDVFGLEAFRVIGNISEKHMGLLEDSIREVGAKDVREEKMKNQLSKSYYVEGSRQNVTTGNQVEEEYSDSVQEQEDINQVDSSPNPKSAVGDPPGMNMENRVSSNINMIICHVASGSIVTSTEALAQIQEILEQEDNVELMSGHINPFLIATLRQMKFIHHLHVTAEEEARKEQVVGFYHSITCNLVSLFQVDILAQEASAGVLKDLISCLISFLLDSPIEELPEEQPTKLVVMKVLEKSNQTRILSSLLLLLQESMTASNNLFAFSEMVAKCLWKTAKRLPQTIDSIYLDQILLDVHLFMKVLPKEKLKQYQSNYPLRALKILLHTLCKLKGEEILGHLTLIEDRGDSDLEANLRKVLSHFEGQPVMDRDSGSFSLAQDQVNRTLAEIFKKINSKETARAGLEDLHEFKERHPEADLEPYLKNCSLLFRSYVKHGLAVIMSERRNKPKTDILSEIDG